MNSHDIEDCTRRKASELLMTEAEQHEVAIAACAAAAIGKEKSAIILHGLLTRHRTWES